MSVEVDEFQDTAEHLRFRKFSFGVEDLDNLVLYTVVLWMRRDYTPNMDLKWESQNACMMAGTRSQDGGCSHSKRVHVGRRQTRAALAKQTMFSLKFISNE